MSSDYYEDDVYNFFINCYHLKDWIEQDNTIAEPVRKAVDSYITSHRQLTICEDICNARKHLYRDPNKRKRSRLPYEHPDFGRKQFAVGITTGADTTISLLDWEVNTDSGPIDAFELAAECVAAWDHFLTALQLASDLG